ncbi:hypothetical protein DVK07_14935 [Halorubrum sp. Atlit-26R]|nr:hypothetical protein DVK07_14935 [Halorubrum sp. Atlit-26R]
MLVVLRIKSEIVVRHISIVQIWIPDERVVRLEIMNYQTLIWIFLSGFQRCFRNCFGRHD